MARVLGSNVDRIASAQVDMLVARVLLSGPDVDVARVRSQQFSALVPRLLELIWRRHLAGATHRRLLRPTVGDTATVCVGFADMVGFTATAQKLNQLELARIVGWFEAEAYELVAAGGGRVVKTIGDEVMFVADDIGAGAAIGVDLAHRFGDDPAFPDVHVGLAAGPVIHRRGDVYGPTVNLAARITGVALPGTVLVSDAIHDVLADDAAFAFRSALEYDLPDIGRVTLWRVRRPGTPGIARRALLASGDPWRHNPARELSEAQLATVVDAVLAADLEPEVKEDVLAEVYAEHELARVAEEADRRLAETDDDAVERLRAIEDDTVGRITAAQVVARQQIAAALHDASARTDDIDAEVGARVQQLIERARRAESVVRRTARARAAVEVARSSRGDRPPDGPRPSN
jgi:adenylate cyclase